MCSKKQGLHQSMFERRDQVVYMMDLVQIQVVYVMDLVQDQVVYVKNLVQYQVV